MGNCFSANTQRQDEYRVAQGQEVVTKGVDSSLKPKVVEAEPAPEHVTTKAESEAVGSPVGSPEDVVVVREESISPAAAPSKGLPYQVHELGPPVPPCEDKRLATIHALGDVVEAPPDPEIESILRLVASIYQAPAALVALFDDKRIFIRQAEGGFSRGDFPWRWSFCGWTMASQNEQVMVVPDATKDARFKDNAMVKAEPGVRFYCGTPLIASNGHRLGTLCFADYQARPDFGPAQCTILNNLSEMVVRVIEKDVMLQLNKHDNAALAQAYTQLKRAIDCFEHCVALVDVKEAGWKVLYVNAAWKNISGMEPSSILNSTVADAFERPGTGTTLPSSLHEEAVANARELTIEHVLLKHAAPVNSARKALVLKLRPASKTGVDDGAIPIGMPSFIAANDNDKDREARSTYYFMTIEAMPDPANAWRTRMGLQSSSALASASASGSYASGGSAWFAGIEGLELGVLLGKGGFGSVYLGTWYGTTVAVKVIDQDLRVLEANGGCSIEALLGSELRHPNVVSTLKFMVHRPPSNSQPTTPQTSSTLPTAAEVEAANAAAAAAASAGSSSAAASTITASTVDVTSARSSKQHSRLGQGWAVMDLLQPQGSKPDSCGGFDSGWSVGSRGAGLGMYPLNSGKTPGSLAGAGGGMQQARTIIVLEYCDKGCLQDAVDRGWLRESPSFTSPCKLEAVLATAYEVATALLYLHSHGIVHGDLSAWNVLLTSTSSSKKCGGGRPFVAKIADFGLARALDIQTKIQTRTYGTITHQPPETLVDGTVSKATDVYSFGVLMWQMITGSRPWAGMSHGQIIMAVASKAVHLQFPPDAPSELAAIAHRCLSYDADKRPAMGEVVKYLDALRCRDGAAA